MTKFKTILRGCKTNNQTYIDVEAGMIVLAFAKVSLQKYFGKFQKTFGSMKLV